MMNLLSEVHSLECRSLSYMSTLAGTASWFSRIYRPPLVAQFLKEVSLTAHSGEVHGIIGVAGSGKSTLLDVISLRALGDIGGTVLLDKHLLTISRFSKLCVYVSFRTRYPGKMTVRSLLYYHARLSIGNATTTVDDIERMVDQSLENFDLVVYSEEWTETLSESARRRTILALQLISDPLLVIIDDILRGLDPLPSFQLISCLAVWAKRKNRIVVVSMRSPRSDIYQLLNRLTILYYGEVFYSGFTKQLPAYFKQAGFTCPSNENPAVYYLSLATVDRETSDRYKETQEQAAKLVEHFRIHSVTPREGDLSSDCLLPLMPIGSSVALCYLERPATLTKMNTLVRRTLTHSISQWPLLVARFFLLPFLIFSLLSLIAFTPQASSPSLPFSASGSIHLALSITAATSVLLAFAAFHPLRTLLFIESTEDVYVGALPVTAYLIVHLPIEMFSVALAAVLWLAGPSSVLWLLPSLDVFRLVLSSLPLLVSTAVFSHALTILLLGLIRSSLTVISLSFSLIILGIIHAGGFVRHFSVPSSLLLSIPSRLNIFVYISHGLTSLLVPQLAPVSIMRNCTRNERQPVDGSGRKEFCRWPNASSYLSEVYPDESAEVFSLPPSFPLIDSLFASFIVFCLLTLCIILYAVPKPRSVSDKFKYR
ncbi:hypothetical protein PMAYCL1PPCAC_07337 [Pristionchus mayeri]|uniref:ABC transporter domain-containing protein n=1 Tax=Pristionchus mayeri TaxID=1317129 RepID=A0AAN5CBK0_9BILA|nr:hypothetical protein PMAYCL1PPCAC_07337 [Pristionchus mayeri]